MNELNENNETIKPSLSNSNIRQDANKKLEVISDLKITKDLPFNMLNLFIENLQEKTYKTKEYIIKQNDPITDIYLIIKGKFILSINQQVEFDVEHDINTFINYQNITNEPFNSERNYEITGKINTTNELDLFIYETRNFFGDIELLANYDKSLFNIKAAEDSSVLGIIDRNQFLVIIEKVKEEFKVDVENKLDMIQERITDILNQRIDLNFDKLKVNKERISYQLSVNHNYKLIIEKLEKIKNHILNNNSMKYNKIKQVKQHDRTKIFNKKRNSIVQNLNKKNKNKYDNRNKQNINRSQSLFEINNYEKKVMNLFQFPTVLRNDTKTIFDKFFNGIFDRHNIKKFNLNKIKVDYDPVYLNKFRNISKLEPQKKFEFLYHVKNHLEEQFKTPKNINNKSNIRQLVTMYNYYITNKNQSKTSSKWSGYITDKENILNRSFGVLNPEIKNNLIKKALEAPDKKKKKSIQRKNPIKLDIIKFNSSFLNNYSSSNTKNINKKIKSNKLFFNSIISEEIKKNTFNWNPKLDFFNNMNNTININASSNINNNKNNSVENSKKFLEQNKKENYNRNNNNINNLNKKMKRLSIVQNLSNNTMFKNVRMKSKNIIELLLKNKCETTKNQMLKMFHKKSNSENNNNDALLKINNNIDLRNEDFIKHFYTKKKFGRSNTFMLNKQN